MVELKHIIQHSSLVHFLLSEEWKDRFASEDLRDGEELLKTHSIRGYEIFSFMKDEGNGVYLESSFRSSARRYHQTEVALAINDGVCDVDSRCSCPDAYLCAHSAALVMHTQALLLEHPETQNITKLGSPQVFDWLNTIKKIQEESEKEKTKPTKPSNQSLAYCLQLSRDNSAHPFISLRICKTTQKGSVIDAFTTPTANPHQPARYMTEADIFPCTLYQQLNRIYYGAETTLEGNLAGKLLQEINKTNRLYFIEKYDEPEHPANLITQGETIKPRLTWHTHPDGSTEPALGLPPHAILIPTEPPYCFDRDKLEIHPVSTEKLSLKMLLAWSQGPTIPAENIENLAPELGKVKLPEPTPLEKELLPKSKPSPSLRLFRKNPFTHGGLHMSGQPEPIIAELTFTYHGHDHQPDLINASHQEGFNVVLDHQILHIPRDPLAEIDFIKILIHDGKIAPVATQYKDLDPTYASSFLPMNDPEDWDMQWGLFISTIIPQLEADGWQIQVDDQSHIEFHTIAEDGVETGLEELTGGEIDWFRFKASYLTPAGKEASLLPLLAAFIKDHDIRAITQELKTVSQVQKMIIQDPDTGHYIAINARQFFTLAKNIHEIFGEESPEEPLHQIQAAGVADSLELDSSQTLRTLAELGNNLKNITSLPKPDPPTSLKAELRAYQLDGFHWLQFLARHGLNGILADDMGLGKTLQTLTHIQAEVSGRRINQRPSLVIAPTSVVGNWYAEAKKFTPNLKVLLLHGADRKERFDEIENHHLILTTYGLLVRDFDVLSQHEFHILALDEAQYIKNPASQASKLSCQLNSHHRISLSGTPIENHLGELWAQMRFLMPGILGSQQSFTKAFRTPIEKHHNRDAQAALNRRIAPLILRRTKDQVATELPPKTQIIHTIPLNDQQVDVYETVRASMDVRIREAITEKGLAKSQIIVLDALLKLRQICCHPQLLKLEAAKHIHHSAKLDFLTNDLLPTLIEEGRKILLFSSFTSMLDKIEDHLKQQKIPYAKIVGSTVKRQEQITFFQKGIVRIFIISLKAGGTGLNLTAADTVIHYDPWWNPSAENQATDRAHRIGQTKPVFVHKLICEGTIEQRIQELQAKKAALVDALLTSDTTKLKIDKETLNNLLSPLD